ncbi:MAG: molybdenum ABC transporter ATP-binding protein [Chelatococcus sp.]|nr:MAG: molybdenum ABC transporter ATP-binding protein [Chelatococcus sp.]
MSPVIEVSIRHRQGDFRLDASFTSDGRLTALFGRSGSGKTSLVNMIAGLVRPDAGRIAVDGRALVDTQKRIFLPKHRRRLGYVFQEARLFPHLTVRQNLLFGRWFAPRAERASDFDAVIDLLGIGHLLGRRPGGLSGGEKQRVAIGRALLASPRLLLMDEPLAALDEARKAEILPYIERLRDEGSVPIVYVSHSVAEVARLATTVVLVENGRVGACGPAAEILSRLDGATGSDGPEPGSLIEAEVAAFDAAFGLTRLMSRAGPFFVARGGLAPGRRVRLRIPASDVLLSLAPLTGISALNVLAGTIVEIAGASGARADAATGLVHVRVDCGGEIVTARITAKSAELLALAIGRPIHAIIKSVSVETP